MLSISLFANNYSQIPFLSLTRVFQSNSGSFWEETAHRKIFFGVWFRHWESFCENWFNYGEKIGSQKSLGGVVGIKFWRLICIHSKFFGWTIFRICMTRILHIFSKERQAKKNTMDFLAVNSSAWKVRQMPVSLILLRFRHLSPKYGIFSGLCPKEQRLWFEIQSGRCMSCL